jgi:hypothetical protein
MPPNHPHHVEAALLSFEMGVLMDVDTILNSNEPDEECIKKLRYLQNQVMLELRRINDAIQRVAKRRPNGRT